MTTKDGEHYVTWKSACLVLITQSVAIMLAGWDTANEINGKVDTRVSRTEFEQHVVNQNRWQDRVDARLDAMSKSTAFNDEGMPANALVRGPSGQQ